MGVKLILDYQPPVAQTQPGVTDLLIRILYGDWEKYLLEPEVAALRGLVCDLAEAPAPSHNGEESHHIPMEYLLAILFDVRTRLAAVAPPNAQIQELRAALDVLLGGFSLVARPGQRILIYTV